jgi:hypothetical protein
MSAPVPRKPELHRILGRFNSRIRRLEINRDNGYTHGGVALYVASYSLSDEATWTPDFSGATLALDTIGCQADEGGLSIPPYWMWWATVNFSIKTSGAPTAGDFLEWAATGTGGDNAGGVGAYGYDPMLDSHTDAQVFGGVVARASSTNGSLVGLGTVASALGTTFAPVECTIALTAIQTFTPQISGGDT